MNWLTNFVRPKIRALVKKENVPDNLWRKCTACEKMVFHRDLAGNLFVCTHCGHHMRIDADLRNFLARQRDLEACLRRLDLLSGRLHRKHHARRQALGLAAGDEVIALLDADQRGLPWATTMASLWPVLLWASFKRSV